jgi:ferredoxin
MVRTAMPYVIAEPCIGTKDASCVEVCPVDCIYEAEDQYYINPDECIDCGACEPECPVQAIFPDTDVPPSGRSTSRRTAAATALYSRRHDTTVPARTEPRDTAAGLRPSGHDRLRGPCEEWQKPARRQGIPLNPPLPKGTSLRAVFSPR